MPKKKKKSNIQNSQKKNRGEKPNVGRTPFQRLCRDLSALLKITHHHNILVNSKRDGLPTAFKQKVEELGKFLKPAHPNPDLAQELGSLAISWGFQVRDRLLTHYQSEIQKIRASIQDQNEADVDFETATQVALNWAKNRMRKKLTNETRQAFLQLASEIKSDKPKLKGPQPTTSVGPTTQTPRQVGQKAKRDQRSPEAPSPSTAGPPTKQQGSTQSQTRDTTNAPTVPTRETSKAPVPISTPSPAREPSKNPAPTSIPSCARETSKAPDVPLPTPGKRQRETGSPSSSPSQTHVAKNPRTEMGDQGASPDLTWKTAGRPRTQVKLGTMGRTASPPTMIPPPTPATPGPSRPSYLQAATSPPREKPIPKDSVPVTKQSYPAKVHRHPNLPHHEDKMSQWAIKPAAPEANILILGTSNMSKITSKPRKDIEIQAFPGGRFVHMTEVLRKLPIQDEPRRVVIAMGINDSNSRTTSLDVIKQEIQATATLAKSRFPHSQIYMAEINHSKMMEPTSKARTLDLNKTIRGLSGVKTIAKMNCNRISIDKNDRYKVHWTEATANNIIRHWIDNLN